MNTYEAAELIDNKLKEKYGNVVPLKTKKMLGAFRTLSKNTAPELTEENKQAILKYVKDMDDIEGYLK